MTDGVTRTAVEPAPERASRMRQRQRLIDACISALHIYGPSRTTVERVVALADLSPGIVRFYFESKAAMLVASLEFLSTEFEQRLLLPVARLRNSPVRALELLVDLYLDVEIASPRKVSVWYSFWGEASSRQEYLEICGRRDEDFAALVRDLMERMIEQTGERHLDSDAVALGLIGVLEMLWQGIAFQEESNIDRPAARRRALNYLRSIFPRRFGAEQEAPRARGTQSPAAATPARLPPWAYADAGLFNEEREHLFRGAWQLAGHDHALAHPGDYLTVDLPAERALLLRDSAGSIRAFRNVCPRRPHALVSKRSGSLDGYIDCGVHGLRYDYDGRLRRGETPGDLVPLELRQQAGLLLVHCTAGEGAAQPLPPAWEELAALARWQPVRRFERSLDADWKLIVEQWLESALAVRPPDWLADLVPAPELQLDRSGGGADWRARLSPEPSGWTARHYLKLLSPELRQAGTWRRLFLPPNQLVEIRGDGALLLQVIPESPGHSRLWGLELAAGEPTRQERLLRYLAGRLQRRWLRQDEELVVSLQSGLAADEPFPETGPVPEAVALFRAQVQSLLGGGAASSSGQR